jgi:hypothetical protein
MLLEEGKVRLNDPGLEIHTGVQELEGGRVQDRPANAPASDPPKYYTIPAAREITDSGPADARVRTASGGRASLDTNCQGLIDMLGGRRSPTLMPKFRPPLRSISNQDPAGAIARSPEFDTLGPRRRSRIRA